MLNLLPSGSGVEVRGKSDLGAGDGVRGRGSGLVLAASSSADLEVK